jgi:hypothetical protein
MSIIKSIPGLRRLAANDTKDEKPAFKGFSTKANERVTEYFSDKPRNKRALDENWNIYSQSEVPFAAVMALAYNSVGDWKIHCEDEEIKKKITKFLRKNNWHQIQLDIVRDCCVFGDAFIEKGYGPTGKLAGLRYRDPRTFQTKIDVKGDIKEYLQTVTINSQSKTTTLKPNEVANYQLFTDPGSPYGLALISPVKDTMKRKTIADEGIAAAIDRHGFPKYHIVVKTPEGYANERPSGSDIDTVAADFRNITTKNEIVTTEWIEIHPLDSKGVENVEEYFNYFQASVTCGVLVPQEVLGLGSGSTEATARVRRLMFQKLVRGFQTIIAQITENEVLSELADDKIDVRIVYPDAVPEDDKLIAESISKLMPKSDPFAVFTQDEIRERFGYPPRELAEKVRKTLVEKHLEQFTGTKVEQKDTQVKNLSDLDEILKEYSEKVKSQIRKQFT